MSKLNETIVNFAVYEDAVEFYGIAEVGMPDLESLAQTISGAGIAGEYEAVILGHFSAMSMKFDFRTVTENTVRLFEQRRHTFDLRAAQQNEDTTAGVEVDSVKYVAIGSPKKLGIGKLAPASPADATCEYSLSYFAQYIKGKKVIEIDPLNSICVVNGNDYLAPIRSALGK